jgi:acyl carrier protein
VLGHSPIDPDENFFDLGGDSLRAVELMAEIETLSGRELPVTLLFEAPSVSALSAALHDAEPRRFSPLVRLSDDTGGTPLILIPGIAGNIMEVVSLAKKLKPWAIPLYGLQLYCGPVLRHPTELMLPAVDLGGRVWLGGKPCKGGPAAPAFGG